MNIAIIGGHGQIALETTRLLIADGHEVISVIRRPEQVADLEALGAVPQVCDIEHGNSAELAAAVAGADALVFAAGAGPGSTAEAKRTIDLGGSLKSIEAAQELGISRFVQISFIGVDAAVPAGTDPIFAAYWNAKREADEALVASDLDWTIVRPGGLTNDPASGCGSVGATAPRGVRTRRADVADFIRLVLAEPRTVGRGLDVWEGDEPLSAALAAHLDSPDA